MIDRVEQVAIRSKAPILLMGPTGAGKSQLARRIYELKHARHQVKGHFVEVNCATLRGDQTMSALVRPCERRVHRAPSAIGRDCCARRTRACCFSMRSANSVSTSRP